MELAARGAAADSPAQRLLIKQERLVGWQIAGERAGFALKVGLGALGMAVVLILAGMVWSASHAHGVVIRAFTVPPQMAAGGVSGSSGDTSMGGSSGITGAQGSSGSSGSGTSGSGLGSSGSFGPTGQSGSSSLQGSSGMGSGRST